MSSRLRAKLDYEEEKILLPSSESDSELSAEEQVIDDPFPEEEEDSDSDSAPDAVSFKAALEDTKTFKRQTTQVIKTQLDERRKKRKEIHEQYMLQKEEKRQKIDEKKLPDDILESLKDDPIIESQTCEENESISNDESEEVKENDSEVLGIHGYDQESSSLKVSLLKNDSAEESLFEFDCKVLAIESKKPKYIPQQAASFKDNLLYGGRIRREKNARVAMLKTEKQQVRLKFNH